MLVWFSYFRMAFTSESSDNLPERHHFLMFSASVRLLQVGKRYCRPYLEVRLSFCFDKRIGSHENLANTPHALMVTNKIIRIKR